MIKIENHEMLALEAAVIKALETEDESALDVIGYGEVTLVLRLTPKGGGPKLACKRLPVFPTPDRFDGYRRSLDEYLERLEKAGVVTAPTQLWSTKRADGGTVAYCIQEMLPSENVGNNYLRRASEAEAAAFFEQVFEISSGAVSPTLGLDAQASNWVHTEHGLVHLDITTPFMRRHPGGAEVLDVKLFMTSLPWGLRDVVRIAMSKDIFEKYYSARGVVLDFLGNLHKEKLALLIPKLLEVVNPKLDKPITEEEVRAYYDGDAKLWALIQTLRKSDRFLQNKVLKRTYPFLLPRAIER